MTTMQSVRALVCVMAVLGCDPPPTSIPPGQAHEVSPAPAPVRPPPPATPTRPIEDPADAGAPQAGEPVTPPPGGGAAGALGAVGSACDSAADCQSGLCEGEGCGPKRGRCVAKGRVCTRDRRAYCGCDGNTFYSSGSCPGARFASRGACGGGSGAKPAADGAACKAAGDCQSGVCEGEGCGEASPGVCVSRKRPCTADLRPYCGCDGATFNASSSCPGRRYASRGGCKK